MNKMKAQLHEWKEALKNITLKKCAITLLGSFILAFGLYHVHSISGVTEGGVLGATLLLEHWTGIYERVMLCAGMEAVG